ncbi:superoxide dismutase [Dactylosporangium sp. AC04546]|uniref:superoxide dismutase n=1 Tax=Dactylosporangium sp. AC04546 TaxID=2862460 RepID=UPI001EE0264B|nr:superoxide dismutase [Dactylosporangium sp. AC04546]WVK85554.1 superoxide dismutase [Dactylosporangium sp. AC04546]
MHRRTLLAGAAGVAAGLAVPGAAEARTTFPEIIDLPPGFQPEGITAGPGTTFYVGSLATGAIYRGDVATGKGSTLVEGSNGAALGLEFDRHGRLWVAGAGTGGATVYSATGRKLTQYNFNGTFVNDVVVTEDAAYFTDSYQPVLYKVPLHHHRLPGQDAVQIIQLPGELGDAAGFNNGIEATPDGRLIIVQMLADRLLSYDPKRGTAGRIDLGGASVLQGDGLLRRGQHLYVVRNFFNIIAKFRLHPSLKKAELAEEITHPKFDIPATVAGFGPHLYAVNARFNVEVPTPETTYNIVRTRS